jgi:integrase
LGQADYLVRSYVLPRLGKLRAGDISRSDVRALFAAIEAPVLANQVIASTSAIFAWAIREEVGGIAVNPCHGIERNETKSRERVLSDSEIPRFWSAFDNAGLIRGTALKLILLTGQRPGEVSRMRREHVVDGWWMLPGDPDPKLGWPGTKNAQSHRVWLSEPVLALLDEIDGDGQVFPGVRKLSADMTAICKKLSAERATPHDLRRTFSTKVAGLGFGRDALNRVTNHREGGIASVYDRHQYAEKIARSWKRWRPASWPWPMALRPATSWLEGLRGDHSKFYLYMTYQLEYNLRGRLVVRTSKTLNRSYMAPIFFLGVQTRA